MELKSLPALRNRRREVSQKLKRLKEQLDAELVIHAFRNNHLKMVDKYKKELVLLDKKIRELK